MNISSCLFVVAVLVPSSALSDPGESVLKQMRDVLSANLKACESEDLEAAKATLHSQSPSYDLAEQIHTPIFDHYDLRYSLLSVKYIGEDDEYAVARVVFSTKKIEGQVFRDNEMDLMIAFKKEGDVWKIWAQAILEIKYVDESEADDKLEGAAAP